MDVFPDTELVRTSMSLASGPEMVCTLPPGWPYLRSSMTTGPLADWATMSTPTSCGTRTVRSPDTEFAPKSWAKPCRSKLMSPLTVLARMLVNSPDAVTSPETLLAVRTPLWLRAITSPLTVLTCSSPEVPSARSDPVTVFSRVRPRTPETRPSPLTVPASTSTPAGTAMLMTTELLLLLLTVPIRFLNQPCGPWSWCRTSSRPSMTETDSGSPLISETSTRATSSSWVTISNRPRTMPSLSERTPSTSMVCGPVTVHVFSDMVPPERRKLAGQLAIYRDYKVTIYRGRRPGQDISRVAGIV